MPYLKELPKTVDEYIKLIKALPSCALSPNKWGAREILIHNVFWHESVVHSVQRLLAERDPQIPSGGFEEINKRAIERERDTTVESLLERLSTAEEQLESLAQNPKTESLRFAFATHEKSYSFMGVIIGLNKHLKKHFPD